MKDFWELSSSSDPRALAVVDGLGIHDGAGPHYSRRTPGSKTFTGVGAEIVLWGPGAVWAVVYQRTPAARNTGGSRGRSGSATDDRPRYVWRNNMFRNLSAHRSSKLIELALHMTYREWVRRYGGLPIARLRTEVDASKVRSTNPGFCYLMAGWEHDRWVGPKRYLLAPQAGVWEQLLDPMVVSDE